MMYVPPYQPRNNSGLDLLMFLEQMKQRQAPKPSMGGGSGLEGLIGGGGAAGGASMLGGGTGAAGAAAADMGIAAPSMMMPELSPLMPSMAGGGGAAGAGATAASLTPLMGVAGVAATPLVGKMIAKTFFPNKKKFKSREYSSEDFGKHSGNVAIKGFDKLDENSRRAVGDKLREYSGKRGLTIGRDSIDGNSAKNQDWDFNLPSQAQSVVNRKLMNNDSMWGNAATQRNLMKQHSASEIFDMGKSALSRKGQAEIGGILGQVDELIKKGQGAGLSPQPQKLVPMGHTPSQINSMKRKK